MNRWRQFFAVRSAWVGVIFLCLLGLTSLCADLVASDLPVVLHRGGETYVLPALTRPLALQEHDNQSLRQEMSGDDWAWWPLCEFGPEQQPQLHEPPPHAPSARHWLGTDDRGRDVFSRIVHGSRASLLVGVCAVAIYVFIGALLGLLAGYSGGRADWIIARLIEVGLTFPVFFLVLIVMALVPQPSIFLIAVVIGVTGWPDIARLVRAEVLKLRTLDFVIAARLSGAPGRAIMLRHLLPNALSPLIVNATFGVGGAILLEAALSFLGFGTPPPTASWGEILGQAFENPHSWWLVLFPGLAIFATVVAVNLVGQRLHDLLYQRT
ncbi:MAG: ABC transporter permease [Deltaproteobacteria bacterium]|nr:ABC transporter permease [Deltaproteobacteria bacterium]